MFQKSGFSMYDTLEPHATTRTLADKNGMYLAATSQAVDAPPLRVMMGGLAGGCCRRTIIIRLMSSDGYALITMACSRFQCCTHGERMKLVRPII